MDKREVYNSSIIDSEHDHLWSLSDRNVVWTYYELGRDTGVDGFELFFKHVEACIAKRTKSQKAQISGGLAGSRWLHFDPQLSMFEDVAVEVTNGFYGSGDCPPPEFWTRVEEGVIVCCIPEKYIALTNIGVELCVNENVEWVPELV